MWLPAEGPKLASALDDTRSPVHPRRMPGLPPRAARKPSSLQDLQHVSETPGRTASSQGVHMSGGGENFPPSLLGDDDPEETVATHCEAEKLLILSSRARDDRSICEHQVDSANGA